VEFARHGVDGVNIRTIAKRAKANSALIRYHFGSKQDLYNRVVRDAMRALKDRMVDAINDAESGPLHRRLLVALVGFLDEERDVQRIVSRAMVEGPGEHDLCAHRPAPERRRFANGCSSRTSARAPCRAL